MYIYKIHHQHLPTQQIEIAPSGKSVSSSKNNTSMLSQLLLALVNYITSIFGSKFLSKDSLNLQLQNKLKLNIQFFIGFLSTTCNFQFLVPNCSHLSLSLF